MQSRCWMTMGRAIRLTVYNLASTALKIQTGSYKMAKKKNKPIRVGIVGCGRAGWTMHPPEMESYRTKFKIVAACDPISERRNMMAERLGCSTYKTIDELLADPNVELVDIATRSPDHTPHAIQALKTGKKVFLEKPIALSYNEAKKLARVAERYPNSLFIRHNRRFEPGFQHVREIIDSGLLGDVYEIKLHRHSYQLRDDWQTLQACGGGQLLNWGPHIIDHALRFIDGKVDSVWSDLRRIAAGGDAEDHVHIILKGGKKPCMVDLEISGGVANPEPVYIVFGNRGSLSSDEKTISLRYLDPKARRPRVRSKKGTPPVDGGFGGKTKINWKWIEKEIPVKPKSRCNMNSIWGHLYAAIREEQPFPITLEEAMQVMKTIDQARRGTPFAAQ